MKKKVLSVLLGCSLLFGTIFANAVSIEFEEIDNLGTNDASIQYEEMETENREAEENIVQNIKSPLVTEIPAVKYSSETEELIDEPEMMVADSYIQNYALRSTANFDITLTPNTNGYGSVSLDWSSYDYADKNFKVYKSSDGGNTYETVGIDYTLVDEVKCLQIYPIADASNQLKTWMETNGYGKGIIKIESVYIDNFNSNPDAYLKDSNGNYKYDVIFFGTWDRNNSKDLTPASKLAVEQYIKSGRGCIVGHDTISYASGAYWWKHNNFIALDSYFGINNNRTEYMELNHNNISNQVKIIKSGLFTTYPWNIGEAGTILTIPEAHNVGQRIDKATKWLEFYNSLNPTTTSDSNYYLSTYNNCASIMTGHSNGAASVDEQKILANLIFYCNQLIFNTYYSRDSSAQDFANPNAPVLDVTGSNFTFSATDNGSTYHYYVESFDKNDTTETGLLDRSVTKSLTVTTGVRKYRYILDNNANTTVTLSNGTETTGTSILENRSYDYLHVAAIDGAGNIGATSTVAIPKTATVTVNHYQMNLDGSTYTLVKTDTITGVIGNNISPSVNSYTGFTSPTAQTETVVSSGNTINYYYTRNQYSVTYIDVDENGNEIGRTTKQINYDTTIRGSDIGGSVTDNVYHNQYRYVGDTSAKVTTDGATVYRNFEFCYTEKESHLTWNDDNNKDGLRPEKYTLKLKQNGKVIDEVELPTDMTDYTFPNLPEYDEDGAPYYYELETVVSDRYKTDIDGNGNTIIEDYQQSSFSVVIPKTIILDGNTGNADYAVSVNGTFYYNDTLTVTPESSLSFTDRSKISSMQADISQQKTEFTKIDGVANGTTTNGSIQVNKIHFVGSWSGNFNFDIKFVMQN